MGKGSGAGILAIMLIGFIAVAFLFGPAIISFVSGLPDLIRDWVGEFQGTLPGAGGDINGQTWIGYTVMYSDGTSEEVREEAPSFSLVPLSITFKNKAIQSVSVHLKARLSCDKAIGVWDADLSMQTEIYKVGDSTPKDSATATYTKTGSSWVSGETKVLASYTVQASKLEQLVSTYGDGRWQLQFNGFIDLSVTVEGAVVDLSAASPAGGMDFVYTNGVPTSLSVSGGVEGVSG